MANHKTIRRRSTQPAASSSSVHFIKADGELRQLTFNPKHIGEIKGTGHALKDPAAIENIVRCMDIAKGWRSFDCRRVCKLTVTELFQRNSSFRSSHTWITGGLLLSPSCRACLRS
jgi:hypothetical protein